MRRESDPLSGVSRIVLELPHLPAVEILLLIVALLLARAVWLLKEGVLLLGKSTHTLDKLKGHDKATSARSRAPNAPGNGVYDAAISSKAVSREPLVSDRVLHTSSKMFGLCNLDDHDVDVGKFMDACRWYADKVLTRMGPSTLVTVREIHANMDKVKQSYQLDPDKHRSMQALLEAECWSGMHQPGGVLLDPSAAIGLLWARRGLLFWISLFRNRMQDVKAARLSSSDLKVTPSPSPELKGRRSETPEVKSSRTATLSAPSMQAQVMVAYEETLAPFNGWVTRNTFNLASRAFPDWRDMEASWAPNSEEAMNDMIGWVEVVEPLLDRMDAIIRSLDLSDMRKSL